MKKPGSIAWVLLLLVVTGSVGSGESTADEDLAIDRIIKVSDEGGRVASARDDQGVFYDRREKDGFYDVYFCRNDGSGRECLTCDNPEISQSHVGNPTVHPKEGFIVFQVADPSLEMLPRILRRGAVQHTSPGAAINNNLWCMNLDNRKVWQLTRVAAGQGTLHPHFSQDGKRLVWAEKNELKGQNRWYRADPWGGWVVKIADFRISSGTPSLANVQTLKPGNLQFYETHGFSPDGSKILFSAFSYEDPSKTLDCFIYDLPSKELKNLTNSPDDWDEFASMSPDGRRIAWVSTKGTEQKRDGKGQILKGKWLLDLWSMDVDGSNKRRLTHFNVKGFPEYDPSGIVVADFDWLKDSRRIVAKVRIQSDEIMSGETIRMILFGPRQKSR